LAAELVRDAHAVRITTRSEAGRAAIEQAGAECWVGTPDRLATLRGALDGVSVACWMLGTASGSTEQLAELYDNRLEFFLTQAIDTTVRGIVYEAWGTEQTAAAVLHGQALTGRMCERNQIPLELLAEDPHDSESWLAGAHAAIDRLLGL
jgi:uncharacterized protein YbjT (DUF2867 family)